MEARRPVPLEPPRDPGSHHPDSERLALHAAGQLRPVERVVLEAHLAGCRPCAEHLRELLEPGARWLRSLDRAPLAAATWERLERRLGSQAAGRAAVEGDAASAAARAPSSPPALRAGLPATAWEELADPDPTLRWRPVPLSRARYAVLAQDAAADLELVLIELGGGSRFPAHVHLGHEEVVVLTGAYRDAYGHFPPGAYHRYAPGTEHSALTDPGETCVAVGLIERGLRFRGLLGVLQWLADPRIRSRRVVPR